MSNTDERHAQPPGTEDELGNAARPIDLVYAASQLNWRATRRPNQLPPPGRSEFQN